MTKADLIEQVSARIDLPKRYAAVLINTLFSQITLSLIHGEKVELRGFGSFRVRQRQARHARNPKTGQVVYVPAKRVPVFKVGKALREGVNS